MSKLAAILFIVLSVNLSTAQISFKTGNAELEIELNEQNKQAKSNPDLFKSSIVQAHNIGISQLNDLLRKVPHPAEALLMIRISEIANKPINVVLQSYQTNKDKGWGYIAKQMGIKPGSPEFHALKGKGNKSKGNGNSGNSGSNGNGKGKKK